MTKKIYTNKKDIIKAINTLCNGERIDFDRRVAVHTYWSGKRMTKQYACAVTKNKYIIHFASWCSCGGYKYDVGEDIEYPLKNLDLTILTNLYNKLVKTINEN